jgi:hypothetical protein
MRSLCFETTLPRSTSVSPRVSRGLACVTALLAAFGVACGEDDDGGGDGDTVALADSASLQALTTEIGIPTTVAVTDGVAWVVESQFDRYAPFGGTEPPSPFRLIGVTLSNGDLDTIPLPDNFFPEGIAVTPGGRIYVGSVATGAIYTIAANTAVAAPFVETLAPSTVGMTVDADGRTLWVCSSNTTATPPTGAVIGLDIATGERVGTHTLEPSANGAFCNDMVQNRADGSLWVTESFGGRIFRIAGDDLTSDNRAEIWLEDDALAPPMPGQFGVNGITLLGGQLFVVVTDRGTLLSIDPSLEAPSGDDLRELSLSLDDDDGVELVRPDGITAVPGSSTDILIVENGLQTDGGKRLLRARVGSP